MKIRKAEFWAAADTPGAIPRAEAPELALAGRSNVGKSSLLNRLMRRKRLARTSRTPGCTRGLIFYRVNDVICLVDLPGYGYANRSHAERRHWKALVEDYLVHREALAGVLVLIDVRRGPQEEELTLAAFLAAHEIPHTWVLTKIDKLARSKQAAAVKKLREALAPAPVLATSSSSGAGIDEVWRWIGGSAGGESVA